MYLAMVERHQLNAATCHTYSVIARDLFMKAKTPEARAYHKANWQMAVNRGKREAANARHMVMELINK